MSFPRYPHYKPSGVEWLGEVPEHWMLFALKRDLAFLTSGSRGWAENYSEDGELFIRIANLTRNSMRLDLSDIQRVTVPDGAEGSRTKVQSGDVIAVRYADDVALGFQHEEEARKYTTELGERLSRFGLMLHADKTRLPRFGKQAEQQRKRRGERKPETFHFLGFTHICGRDRRGRFALQRRTEGKRQRATLREVKKDLLQRRHLPIPEQGEWLASVIRGHAAYYAVPNNGDRVYAFKCVAQRHWYRALQRRSQRSRLSWAIRAGGGPTPRVLRAVPTATFMTCAPP